MILLENGQQILLPEVVVRVPALMLLNEGFRVVYGEEIYGYLRPRQEAVQRQATQQNMEPNAFSFGLSGGAGSVYGIVSDQFSFLDQNAEELNAQGNGGMRQMHSYVPTHYIDQISNTPDENNPDFKKVAGKLSQDLTVEKLQEMREQEMASIAHQTVARRGT